MAFFSSSKDDQAAKLQQTDKDVQKWRSTGACPRCGVTFDEEGQWAHARSHQYES